LRKKIPLVLAVTPEDRGSNYLAGSKQISIEFVFSLTVLNTQH